MVLEMVLVALRLEVLISFVVCAAAGVTECPAGGGTQLVGRETLCPNQVGLYRCNTTNQTGLEWIVDIPTQAVVFGGFHATGIKLPFENIAAVAYLVDREVDGGNRGNRISVLEYTPDPSILRPVIITCSGCSKSVMVVGTDSIQPPTELNGNGTISTGGNTTIHTWNHPKEEMVAHYNITLSGQDMSGQTFHIMPGTRRIEVPRIPGLSYKGRLSAVSICGSESDPVVFEVMVSSTSHLKIPVIVMLPLALLGLWS